MLSYLRLCLANSASLTPSLELLKEPELISSVARHYIEKLVSENGPVTAYLDLALELLAANPSKVPLQCLLEIVAGVPKLSAVLLSKLDMFKTLQHHNKEDVREMVAQIIAVVVCQSYDTLQIDSLIHDLCRNLKEKPLEQQHGSILTLGYTVGRIVRSHLSADRNEKSCREQLSPRLSTATSLVIDFLFDSLHPMTLSAACLSVGEMGRCGPLLDSTGESSRAVEKLLNVVDDAKIGSKIREKAALAAGYLSLGELEYPRRKHVIEHFLTSTEVSDPFFKKYIENHLFPNK
jgi:proteasome component ECM29